MIELLCIVQIHEIVLTNGLDMRTLYYVYMLITYI